MRKRKLHTYPVITCFMVFLIGVLVVSVRTIPQQYNAREEKALAQIPMIYDMKSFDEFTSSWDSFVSDQFPGRNEIVAGTQDATLSGSEDSVLGDLYVLSSDYIFNGTPVHSEDEYEKLASAIRNRQDESGLQFVYTVVPQKNLSLAENERLINEGADLHNLALLLDKLEEKKITAVNCCDYIMSLPIEERVDFYFKTDYHWNELGAYTASKYMAKVLASDHLIQRSSVPSDDDFIWYDLTGKDYLGDLQKQISDEVTVEEYIPVYEPAVTEQLHYYTDFTELERARFDIIAAGIDDDVLDYNKMSMKNPAYLRVENPRAPEKKSVLVLRDSYQCCMTDYLSEVFSEIHLVDPRSVYAPGFDEILKNENIDFVLLIYHNSNVSYELIDYLNAE